MNLQLCGDKLFLKVTVRATFQPTSLDGVMKPD